MDSKVVPALLLTFLSGVSTAVGGLIVCMFGVSNSKLLGRVVSFASGVMIYISFMDLLPEANMTVGFGWSNIFFFIGVVFFWIISRLVPEPHIDAHDLKKKSADGKVNEKHLWAVGLKTAIGISLHNFPEGIAVYLACLRGTTLGLPLAIAIAAHNIPEGMAVASPILSSTKSKWSAFKWSLVSGLCEPLGAIVVGVLFSKYLTDAVVHASLAAVAGIMVLISIAELIPAALEHGLDAQTVAFWNVVGMALMALNVWWLHYYLGFHQHVHAPSSGGHSHSGHSHAHNHAHHGHSHAGHGHSHGHGHAHKH